VIVAVSVEIHAAIVGGFISGVVVLVGVLLAEWLRRRAGRHEALGRAAHTIILKTPGLLSYLLPEPLDERRLEWGSPGWDLLQEVFAACAEADAASRPKMTRNRKAIRDPLNEINVRVGAAHARWAVNGSGVTYDQVVALSALTSALGTAAFGKRESFVEIFERYMNEGLPT
jgi:hypothetical protein